MRRPRKTRASTVISHVPARGQTVSAYRLTLHRRGRYRFGPLRVSTRFPLALVRGQFTLSARAECLVIPRIGRLLPEWNRLLDAELAGDRRRHPQRGHAEGDYYGLRPWQSGDSLRWVHWRTTAKLGRPVVRQFERRRSRDVALVLDPWQPASPSPEDAGRMELAVSLTATVVNDVTGQGNSRLVVAIGGLEGECYAGPSSPLFCQEVLAHLAEVAATGDYAVGDLVQQAFDAAGPESRLIIISTRSADAPSLASAAAELPLDPDELVWINTGSAELSSLFVLE